MASALTTAGRADEAVLLLETVAAAQSRALSTDHSDLLASRFFLAYALVEAGRPHGAAELFEALVVQGRPAWAHRHAGRADEAVAVYERLEAVLGPDQPWTLTAVRGLARARRLAASG